MPDWLELVTLHRWEAEAVPMTPPESSIFARPLLDGLEDARRGVEAATISVRPDGTFVLRITWRRQLFNPPGPTREMAFATSGRWKEERGRLLLNPTEHPGGPKYGGNPVAMPATRGWLLLDPSSTFIGLPELPHLVFKRQR